jgi:hypothetical protein
MHRKILALAITLSSLLATPLWAADEPPVQQTQEYGRALQLTIQGAITNFAKNIAQARIAIQWDLIPPDSNLKLVLKSKGDIPPLEQIDPSASGAVPPIKFTIHNSSLGIGNRWIDEISPEGRKVMLEALHVECRSLEAFKQCYDPNKSRVAFDQYWKYSESPNDRNQRSHSESIGGDAADQRLTADQYYRQIRDFQIVSALLQSQGITLSLQEINKRLINTNLGSVSTSPLKISADNILWDFVVYKSTLPNSQDVNYYRFTVSARLDRTLELTVPNTDSLSKDEKDKGLTLQCDVTLAGNQINSNLLLETTQKLIKFSPQGDKLVANLNENEAASNLTTRLGIFGNATRLSDLGAGLLSRASNTSLVTGGLIGGTNLESLVGVNFALDRSQDLVPGVLLGISPGSSSSVYLGPSLQTGALTLSAGGRFTDNGNSLSVGWGGVVSLDLSRLFEDDAKPVTLTSTGSGGGWREVSEELLKEDLAFLRYTLEPPSIVSVALMRIKDGEGKYLASKEIKTYTLTVSAQDKPLFLPRGTYRVIGQNGYSVKIKSSNCPTTNIQLVSICKPVGSNRLAIVIGEPPVGTFIRLPHFWDRRELV